MVSKAAVIQSTVSPRAAILYRMLDAGLIPDPIVRAGIRWICGARLREQNEGGPARALERKLSFIQARRLGGIARETRAANVQHYEVPVPFFEAVLGPRMKYSSGFWPGHVNSLADSEDAMLKITCERAGVGNGQRILDLGCGWGALSLYLCEHFQNLQITAVSNSATQREFIEKKARERGFTNLRVETLDANALQPAALGTFDRVISVEMFEHLWNHEALLERIRPALAPDGAVYIHIFTHREHAYPFLDRGDGDWMAREFFTGGSMPGDDLLIRAPGPFEVSGHWRFDGTHYQKTAGAWLERLDAQRDRALAALAAGMPRADAERAIARWRVFFMACAEMFGYRKGTEWLVSHYLLTIRG